MKKIWGIRVSTSKKLGMGHLVRSLELAYELKNVILYIDPDTKNIVSNYFPNSLIEEKNISSSDKAIADLKKGIVIGLIFDNYKIPKNRIEDACSFGCVAVIDDFFNYWKKPIVIISSLSESVNDKIPRERLIYGHNKIIIPNVKSYQPNKNNDMKMEENSLLVQFGSIDNNNLTCRFLKSIISINTAISKISIVLSDKAPHKSMVLNLLDKFNNSKVLEVQSINELQNLYSTHEVLFGSAGVSLLERIYLGFHSVILSQNASQDANATAAENLKLAKYIGRADLFTDEKLKKLILNYIQYEKNNYKKNLDTKLIDGKGAKRIVDKLLRMQKNNTHVDI